MSQIVLRGGNWVELADHEVVHPGETMMASEAFIDGEIATTGRPLWMDDKEWEAEPKKEYTVGPDGVTLIPKI
ncbi:MAG: hypothetical protein M3Q34_02760 [bacterium]|nr:hypothetical protein [bacterium]